MIYGYLCGDTVILKIKYLSCYISSFYEQYHLPDNLLSD